MEIEKRIFLDSIFLTLFLAGKGGGAGSSERYDCMECVSPMLRGGYWEETSATLSAPVPPRAPPAAVFAVCLCAGSLLARRQGHFRVCQVLGPLFVPSNRLLLSGLHLPANTLEDSI